MKYTRTILHSIPGRTRLQLNHSMLKAGDIEARMRSITGVYSAVYSDITGTVVLHHAYHEFSKSLLDSVQALLGKHEVNDTEEKSTSETTVKDLGLVLGAFILENISFIVFPYTILAPTSIAMLYASRDIIKNGLYLKSVTKPNPDTLTTSALAASLIKGSPQSALVIYLMSTISEVLTERTVKRTRNYVRDTMVIDTPYAWLITEDEQEVKVETNQVEEGQNVIVFQGEKIPFDGTVQTHIAQVDQSSITGEYMPVQVQEGSYVFAGSIVVEGKIILTVDKVGEDLTVNRMIRLIEEGQENQASIQMSSERFTNKMVPVSFGLAAMIYLVTGDWNRVLNMLVIDYVCGVKLSTATAISASIGQAARQGVLIKGGQTLEDLSETSTLVLDKTGTITEGRPFVTEVKTFNRYSEEAVLAYAASTEEHSTHPIAEAILTEVAERSIIVPKHDDATVENIVGKGVSVCIDGQQILVGNPVLMEENQVNLNQEIDDQGIFVAKETELIGMIKIEDKVRAEISSSINQMRGLGVNNVVMLTGDHHQAAEVVANQVPIDEFKSDMMPQEKADYVEKTQSESNRKIMMVGDGINDTPSLAYADIGVTLGAKKTDIAMETSDVIIHSDNPLLLPAAMDLSQKTMKIIRQNIVATLVVNTGAILLGTFGIIKPTLGATIHNAMTIAVVLNSAKLNFTGGQLDVSSKISNGSYDTRENQAHCTSLI